MDRIEFHNEETGGIETIIPKNVWTHGLEGHAVVSASQGRKIKKLRRQGFTLYNLGLTRGYKFYTGNPDKCPCDDCSGSSVLVE